MNPEQGDVVIGPDFIGGNNKRPFIVINNSEHPFEEEECLVVLVTTTERKEAIALQEEKFLEGKLPKESYASPWTVTTLKNQVIKEKMGTINEETLKDITKQINQYIKSER